MPQYKTKTKTVTAIEVTNNNINNVINALSNRGDVSNITVGASLTFSKLVDGKTLNFGLSFSKGQFVVEDGDELRVMSKEEFLDYFETV